MKICIHICRPAYVGISIGTIVNCVYSFGYSALIREIPLKSPINVPSVINAEGKHKSIHLLTPNGEIWFRYYI